MVRSFLAAAISIGCLVWQTDTALTGQSGLDAAASADLATFGALPSASLRKCDPILRQVAGARGTSLLAQGRASSGLLPQVAAGEGALIPCWIAFEVGSAAPDLRSGAGLRATAKPGLASGRLTLGQIAELALDPRVVRIESAQRTRPFLNVSLAEIQAEQTHDATGAPPLYSGYSGVGVLIGIVDTGLDLDHPDFRAETGTRVVALWDQTVSPSVLPPSGFAYGREWTHAQIDGGSSTQVDSEGHGSHVAGIALGDGSATGGGQPAYEYIGVAPEAQLVVVKTDFYSTSIADAVEYIFEKATALGLPAVVNLSLGHHYGPHDGFEATDLAMNALVGPGRIVVAAAGNEQQDAIHAEASIAAGDSSAITIELPAYPPAPGAANDYLLVDGYYTQGSPIEITVVTPNGARVGPISPGDRADESTGQGGVYIENDWYDPATEDANFFVQIYDPVAGNTPVAGVWSIVLTRAPTVAPATACQADLWLYNSTFASSPRFVLGMTPTKLVASPATADSVIAVGAYVTKKNWQSIDGNIYQYSPAPIVGAIAAFSSRGPRRDGGIKPDISAPGQGIASARSSDYMIPAVYVTPDGLHMINQGTSMAAPHATGVAALMLQAHGSLSKRALLTELQETARIDGHASGLPNSTWGWGKLDAWSATNVVTPVIVEAVTITRTSEGVRLEWSVPLDASNREFAVLRRWADSEAEEIARVGPGPRYSFVDNALIPFVEPQYWLLPLDGDRRDRLGPYQAGRSGPVAFAISLIGANPVRGELACALALPSQGTVSVDVIDAAGRSIGNLHRGTLDAGAHVFRWSGRGESRGATPSGVYWLRAVWNGRQETRRFLWLRDR